MKTQNYGNVGTWYGPDQLSSLIKKYAPNVNVLMSASVLLGLSKQLDQIGQNGQYFISLNINCLSQNFEDGSRNDLQNNHWAGLYVVKDSNQTSVTYLDPMGKLINPQLVSEIRNRLGTNNIVQPLLNKPVQCVQLDPSGSFIEKGNDADCGPFLVYCVACMANTKAIRQDIKTLEQSASFGEYLRVTFSKETSFDEIYKAGNTVVEAPMKNKAAKEFEQYKLHEFKQWYTPQVVEYLTHLNSQDAFLRYVFFDRHPEDFKNQLESICAIKNFYGQSQKVKGISFISKEPGLGENHFVFGTFIGNKLIVINPVGETEHVNFYEALNEFKKVYKDVDVFLSNTILQKDSKLAGSGLVSCGPICIELMRHVSLLPAEKVLQLTKTGAESKKYGLDYKEINVAAILPDTLSALLNPSSGDDYITKVVEIRKSHNSILSGYSSLKNLKVEQQNELLDTQCTNHPMQCIVKSHVQDKGIPKTEIIDQYLQQGDKIKNISPASQKPQKALFNASLSNSNSEEMGSVYEVMSKRSATKAPTKIVSQSKSNGPVKVLKDEINVTKLPKINDIKSEVERVLGLEATNSEKVVQLKKIETDQYKPWIRKLAYKTSVEEIAQLTVVLNDLGYLITKVGELSNEVNDKLKCYTDAAVFYQYVISILKENQHLQKDRKVLESLKKDIADPYEQIDILQKEILSAIGGNIENISSAAQEMKDNRNNVVILRKNTDELLTRLEQLKKTEQSSPESAIIDSNLSVTNAKGKEQNVVVTERKIFEYIASQMQSFLGDLYQDAEQQLPNKPEGCEYAVIGLGSMALKQMTPWSDLEFAIIINKYTPETVTYLRNLTHLVHFKMINLGETVIPTSKYGLDMSHLVKVAVNFDLGGKTPLGRIDQDKQYDLIGTIDWLMNYVRNEGDEKTKGEARDKALPYMLEKVCHVCGNEDLVKNYQGRVTEFLQEIYDGLEEKYQGLKQYQARALKVLEEGSVEANYSSHTLSLWKGDIEKLTPVFGDENEGRLFDVKSEIYRLPDRMIYNLGLYFGVEGDSAWGTIERLYQQEIINEEGAKNLENAVSFATTLRLKTYSHNGGQRETMSFFELALEHLNETDRRKLVEQTLYVNDTSLLHDYYYTMLGVIEIERGLCNPVYRVKVEAVLKESNLHADTHYNKGMVHARLLEYYRAIKYMKIAQQEKPEDLNILEKLLFLYNKAGIIEGAISVAEEILKLREIKYKDDANHPDIATDYNNLGVAYSTKDEYNIAIKYLHRALDIRLATYQSNPDHSSFASSYNNLGAAYLRKGENDTAINYYKQALGIQLKAYEQNPNHSDIAASYNNLGGVYHNIGEYDTAIRYCHQALDIMLIAYEGSPNHPAIAASYHNLGETYCAKGEYDVAIKYYNYALKIRLVAYNNSPNHPAIAANYHNLGETYYPKGEYDVAIKYFHQALDIRLIAYQSNPNHSSFASSYNSLGNAYQKKGEYDTAIRYFHQALDIRLIAYQSNPNHSSFASSYNSLGNAYDDKGEYDTATKYYRQALEIQLKAYEQNPNHPDIAASYNNLGGTYAAKGEYDTAIRYCHQALDIMLVVYESSPNHPSIAASYCNLGNAYDDKGEYDTATKYYHQALEIQLKAYEQNPNHPDIAVSCNDLGGTYAAKGEYDTAIKYYHQALDIMLVVYESSPNHPSIAINYNDLGNAYQKKSDYDRAIKYYHQALDIMLVAYEGNPYHPDIAVNCNNLGNAYRKRSDYDRAIKYYHQALDIMLVAYKDNPYHPDIAVNHNNLGVSYDGKGEYDKAIKHYQQTLAIELKVYENSPYHPEIANNYDDLGNAYRGKGDHDTAIKYYHQALKIRLIAYENSPRHPNIVGSYNILGAANLDKGDYEKAHFYAKQHTSGGKTLYNMTLVQLGNKALLANEYDKAREYYKEVDPVYEQIHFNSVEFIELQSEYKDIAYESNLLLATINCQLVLIKIDPDLKYNNHYHNLACLYACHGNVHKANAAFIKALTHPKAIVTGGLHIEYAQFLIINKDLNALAIGPQEISKHLYAAINSTNLEELQYGKIEKDSICGILRDLLKKKNFTITLNPKMLAYYLLIKHPEYIEEVGKVGALLETFCAYCNNLQDEISFRLLSNAYKGSGDEKLTIKYSDYANVIEQINKIIDGKLKLDSDNCTITLPKIEDYAITLDKLALVAVSESRLSDVAKFYAKLFQIYNLVLVDKPEQLQVAANNLATFSLLTEDIKQFIKLKLQYEAELNHELIILLGQDVGQIVEFEQQIIAQVQTSLQKLLIKETVSVGESNETEVPSLGENDE